MGDKSRGLYEKFIVRRTDQSDMAGGKHMGCEYFVLDVTHDPHAKAALLAYADSCEADYPLLAADLRAKYPPIAADAQNAGRDWIKDVEQENGNYQNKCVRCGDMFIGHKGRPFCKICATATTTQDSPVPASAPSASVAVPRSELEWFVRRIKDPLPAEYVTSEAISMAQRALSQPLAAAPGGGVELAEEIAFIEELASNAEMIAESKRGADKHGWLDDAKMHRRVLAALQPRKEQK